MHPLITNGNLYIAQPPLYKVSVGKKGHWAYSDVELNEKIESLNGKRQSVNIQRYKGLGEMSADQLWDTTMNFETRTLLKVSEGDVQEADHIFSLLMGDVVEPRREFIQAHAREVENLDI